MAKNNYTVEQFIHIIAPYVVLEYQLSRILPSVTLAQAIIESRYGNSAPGNNLFGIKGSYKGSSQLLKTTEYVNGKYIKVYAKFRKYPNWYESIADHSWLLCSNKRYKNVIGCKEYILACQHLKAAGYATAPDYDVTLIKCIETYNLTRFDEEAIKNYG